MSPAGQQLYVDGQVVGSRSDTTSAQIFSGYWRVGGDRVTGWVGAGTYPVKLTVTDDDGATGSVTHPVTVTAPAPNAPFVTDPFDRTLATGLGNADVGGAWTASTPAGFAVADGAGLGWAEHAGGHPVGLPRRHHPDQH